MGHPKVITATADPYGMTNRRNGNSNYSSNRRSFDLALTVVL